MDMRKFDEMVALVAEVQYQDDSLCKLIHLIADMLDALGEDETANATALGNQISDIAWALHAKTEAFVDAIMHKRPPPVIHLPDENGTLED